MVRRVSRRYSRTLSKRVRTRGSRSLRKRVRSRSLRSQRNSRCLRRRRNSKGGSSGKGGTPTAAVPTTTKMESYLVKIFEQDRRIKQKHPNGRYFTIGVGAGWGAVINQPERPVWTRSPGKLRLFCTLELNQAEFDVDTKVEMEITEGWHGDWITDGWYENEKGQMQRRFKLTDPDLIDQFKWERERAADPEI